MRVRRSRCRHVPANRPIHHLPPAPMSSPIWTWIRSRCREPSGTRRGIGCQSGAARLAAPTLRKRHELVGPVAAEAAGENAGGDARRQPPASRAGADIADLPRGGRDHRGGHFRDDWPRCRGGCRPGGDAFIPGRGVGVRDGGVVLLRIRRNGAGRGQPTPTLTPLSENCWRGSLAGI